MEREISPPKPLAEAPEVRPERERAIATLSEAFTKDTLTVEQFEERLSSVYAAATVAEVQLQVADLTPAASTLPARVALAPAEVQEQQLLLSVLGSTERMGTWSAARAMRAVSVLGSIEVDFREARLPAGVVELEVSAILGSIEITVPPDLEVEMHGVSILGSFESIDRTAGQRDPERTILRIRGVSILGSVEVRTRLVGESGRQARARLKQERKNAARLEAERRRGLGDGQK
ncbi:MAG: LiaF-related protein [Myxococcota bacterium]